MKSFLYSFLPWSDLYESDRPGYGLKGKQKNWYPRWIYQMIIDHQGLRNRTKFEYNYIYKYDRRYKF